MPTETNVGFFKRIRNLFRNRKENNEKEKLEKELKIADEKCNEASNKTKAEIHRCRLSKDKRTAFNESLTPERIIKEFPEAASDVEFMKQAVEKDCTNIRFDKTNDKDVYLTALREYNKKAVENVKDKRALPAINQNIADLEKKINDEIDNPKEVEEGKFKVSKEYLFEEIRNCIRNGTTKGKKDLDFGPITNLKYFDIDGYFDKEAVEKIEELFKDKDKSVFWHSITNHGGASDLVIKKIFEEGIWHKEGDPTDINKLITGKNNGMGFVDLLSTMICNKTELDGYEYCPIIAVIPNEAFEKESEKCVFGSDYSNPVENDINRAYILPEYVVGRIQPGLNGQIDFVDNNVPIGQRKNYKYHFKDKSLKAIEGKEEVLNKE